ncbi:hypothetical protein [Peribacillus glennii]|uniref:Uncharacterized protein n=1 Tax=Peribacillus glennii TaxID=2303991 RepID=A0A372LID5_9BACI|nr:hypothetical protein [Peribacillus glennii]RFU65754.1 hypothetical protein D0466_07740 [Peribacillus glennii]
MDFLFDLLISNLPVIIIVIGVLSSVIGKWGASRTEQTEKRKKIPEILKEAWEENYPEKKSTEKKPQRQQDDVKQSRSHLEKAVGDIEAKLHQARESMLPDHAKHQSVVFHKVAEENKIPIEQTDLRFDRQKLMDGIIMAEVLGPPKSKQRRRR